MLGWNFAFFKVFKHFKFVMLYMYVCVFVCMCARTCTRVCLRAYMNHSTGVKVRGPQVLGSPSTLFEEGSSCSPLCIPG